MNNEQKLEKALEETKVIFAQFAEKYSANIAKQAFFRVSREEAKRQSLLEKKRQLEAELEELNQKV